MVIFMGYVSLREGIFFLLNIRHPQKLIVSLACLAESVIKWVRWQLMGNSITITPTHLDYPTKAIYIPVTQTSPQTKCHQMVYIYIIGMQHLKKSGAKTL